MTVDQLENSRNLGEILTRTRESMSLSQKEIASRLNLKEEVIAALDTSNFDNLPAPTYVRGYIRSYARAINLDANNLIDIYQGSAAAPPEILPDVKPKLQASSKDTSVKTITYLITFTLMILIIIWWQSSNIVSTTPYANKPKAGEGGESPSFTYSYNIVTHPEILNVSDIENADYDPELNAEVGGESASPDTLVSPETTDQESLKLRSRLETLKMELTAESWIEVHDALGERLYFDLAKPGEKINLAGNHPLSVKLGNARGVSVSFKGKIFDTSKYTEAGIARFFIE